MNIFLWIALFILIVALIMSAGWVVILNLVWFMLEPIVGKKGDSK